MSAATPGTAVRAPPLRAPAPRPRRRLPPPASLPDLAAALSHALPHADGAAAASAVADAVAHAVRGAPLAYEPVVLPCHNMGCGDAVYRR